MSHQTKSSDGKRLSWRAALMQTLVVVVPSVTLAQQLPSSAPENPQFTQHRMSAASVFRAVPEMPTGQALLPGAGGTGSTGLRPAPLDRSHMTGTTPSTRRSGRFGAMAVTGTFPAAYDLRSLGFLPPVRDQGQCGSCWTFASIGSAESNALMSATGSFDFSENNLNVRHGFAVPACQGGNADMSAAYQTRWGNIDGLAAGLVNETDDPYTGVKATSVAGLSPRVHVQEVLALPTRSGPTDNSNYKYAIQNYGAVDVSIYADNGMASSSNSAFWNQGTKAYYYNGTSYPNHEVALVGWDDNYAATNFASRPAGNGAFIVRNSWSAAWGNAGYFYISYYDNALSGGHVFRTPESASNYVRAYLYDPFGQTSNTGYGTNSAYGANVFTAAASETLTAVAIDTQSVDSAYEISIYTGVTSSPATGVLEGGAVNTTGTAAFAGYHTIPLTRPVNLLQGQKFAIVVKFTSPGLNYPIPLERPFGGYANATASAGQSWMSADGNAWSDVTAVYPNSNVDIRGYTGLPRSGVSLVSSANPSTTGQSVTFTATVAAQSGTPTGTVTFTDGSTTLCNSTSVVPVSGTSRAQAICSTNALAAGSHTIVAAYSGSAAVTAGTASVSQTVNAPAPAATTASVTSSANPSTTGQSVTFTATISSAGTTPSGPVLFADGSTTVCNAVSLVPMPGTTGKATAVCSTSALTAGSHGITAKFAGSAAFGGSSAAVAQTVSAPAAAKTTVSLASGANPSNAGQSVTFTAVVAAASGTPSGAVVFTDGTAPLCTGNLAVVSGRSQATCAAALQAGSHTISAAYAGTSAFAPGSASLGQIVNVVKVASTTVLASNANPSSVGQVVTLTAVVSGGAGNAVGTVTFSDGTTKLCTGVPLSLVNGKAQASCATGALAAGAHALTAAYSGGLAYNPSSGSLSQTVNVVKAPTAIGFSGSLLVSGTTQTLSITGTVSAPTGVPTGTLVFKDGSATLCTATLASVAGKAQGTCKSGALAAGSHSISAAYSGDANFLASSTGAVSLTIVKR